MKAAEVGLKQIPTTKSHAHILALSEKMTVKPGIKVQILTLQEIRWVV